MLEFSPCDVGRSCGEGFKYRKSETGLDIRDKFVIEIFSHPKI